MMERARIASAGNSSVTTADGNTMNVIGTGRAAAGDVAWSLGEFVFCPGRPSSRPPILWSEAGGDMIVAYYDGTYELRDSSTFKPKGTGTFKHWPTDFLDAASYYNLYFAYNDAGSCVLLVKWTNYEYDNDGNMLTYYTGFNLKTGDQLFSVAGSPMFDEVHGFYVEAASDKVIHWGGVWVNWSGSGYLYCRNYVNGSCAEVAKNTEEITCSNIDLSEIWDVLDRKLVTDPAMATHYIMKDINYITESATYSYDWLSGIVTDYGTDGMSGLYPDGNTYPLWDESQFTFTDVSASVAIGNRSKRDAYGYFTSLIAANPKTEAMIGQYAQMQSAYTTIQNTLRAGATAAVNYAGVAINAGNTRGAKDLLDSAVAGSMSSTYYYNHIAWNAYSSSLGIPLFVEAYDSSPFEGSAGDPSYLKYSVTMLAELPAVKTCQESIVAICTASAADTSGSANIYQKNAAGTAWVFIASVTIWTNDVANYPLSTARIPYGGGSPICPHPKVRYSGSTVTNQNTASEVFVGTNNRNESVRADVYGSGTVSGGDVAPNYIRKSCSGDNVFYITELTPEVTCRHEVYETVTNDDGSVDTTYVYSVSTKMLAKFGGTYYADGGNVPVESSCSFTPEPAGEPVQSISLPYTNGTQQASVRVEIGETTLTNTLVFGGVDITTYYSDLTMAAGKIDAGAVLIVNGSLYMPDGNGYTQDAGEASLTGRCCNTALPKLKKSVSSI